MSAENETPWICIARTGTFGDSEGRPHTFTAEDLERISAGYDPAKSEAPLVFGHPKDADPAYGWVAALKREGGKLFAQFAHVPESVKKLVQDRRYRYVSMSLSPDKRRLLHVGLLGAAAPAIDGLAPVSLSAEAVTINFSALEDTLGVADGGRARLGATRAGVGGYAAGASNPHEGAEKGGSMNPEELQRQIGALNEQIKALQRENGDLKAKLAESAKGKDEAEKGKKDAEEKSAGTAAEFAAFKTQLAGEKRATRVDALINAGKLAPAKKDETLSFAAALAQVAQPVNFTAPGGKPEQISAEERYFRDLEARPQDPRFNFTAPAPLPGHAAGLPADAVPGDITSKL
jgi:hypothetical protein